MDGLCSGQSIKEREIDSVRLCAISVDLDEIHHYYAIHGLTAACADGPSTAVYDLALPRIAQWSRALRVPITLFVVGADVSRPKNAQALRVLTEEGYEIGNHSFDHNYDFTHKRKGEIRRQIVLTQDAIENTIGIRPLGFRAPGYIITDEVFEILQEEGIQYDSSVFPCPAYYLAKLSVLFGLRALGRSSHSIVDNPRMLLAPYRPYRIGKPYWRTGNGLVEIPVQVTRGLRLPCFGTSLTATPTWAMSKLLKLVMGESTINLELHGIDFLDEHDGLRKLRKHQWDIRIPHTTKQERLAYVVKALHGAGYSFVVLHKLAQRVPHRKMPQDAA